MKPLKEKLEFAVTFNTMFDVANNYNTDVYWYAFNGNKVHMNTGAELKSEPVKDLKLKLGFDGGWAVMAESFDKNTNNFSSTDVFGWDMLFDTSYKWVSGGLYAASEGTPFEGYNRKNGKYTADVGAYVKFATEGKKDKANYLLEGLDAGVYLGMYRFISTANKPADSKETLPLVMKVWASYERKIGDSMSIKPFATFWGETNHTKHLGYAGKEWNVEPYFGIAYDIGVTYMPVEKVEITAKWEHGKVDNNGYPIGTKYKVDHEDPNKGKYATTGHVIGSTANHNGHNGTFVLSCKVKY